MIKCDYIRDCGEDSAVKSDDVFMLIQNSKTNQ